MSMKINIHQQNAILGIDIQQAQLKILRSRQLRMNIEQQNGSMQIEWNRPQVKVSGANTGMGVNMHVPEIQSNLSKISGDDLKLQHVNHAGVKNERARHTPKFASAQNVMDRATATRIQKKIDLRQMEPGARTKIEPGYYTIKYQGGSIDISVEEMPGEIEFQNYSVDIFLEQEPMIEITVDEYLDEMVPEQKEPFGQFIDEAL